MQIMRGHNWMNATTKDGKGNTVSLVSPNGMISWMNTVASSYGGVVGDDSGNIEFNILTHVLSIIRNAFLKIVNIFQRLFGL